MLCKIIFWEFSGNFDFERFRFDRSFKLRISNFLVRVTLALILDCLDPAGNEARTSSVAGVVVEVVVVIIVVVVVSVVVVIVVVVAVRTPPDTGLCVRV